MGWQQHTFLSDCGLCGDEQGAVGIERRERQRR